MSSFTRGSRKCARNFGSVSHVIKHCLAISSSADLSVNPEFFTFTPMARPSELLYKSFLRSSKSSTWTVFQSKVNSANSFAQNNLFASQSPNSNAASAEPYICWKPFTFWRQTPIPLGFNVKVGLPNEAGTGASLYLG